MNVPIDIGNVVSTSAPKPSDTNGTYFYARFLGYLVPSASGTYALGVNCADGCNFFLGGRALIANLVGTDTAQSTLAFTRSASIALTAGVYYPLIVEWQHGAGANYELQLMWTTPAGTTQLIPSGNLSEVQTSVTGTLDSTWINGAAGEGLWFPNDPPCVSLSNPFSVTNGTFPATALPSIEMAPAGNIVLTDGAGNIKDSGTALSTVTGGSGGGGSSSNAFGTRASLPGTVPAAGSMYYCTDSPFAYISDGTKWNALMGTSAIGDPSLNPSLVQLVTGTWSSRSANTSLGGIRMTGTAASGDQVFAIALPVTPSATLKIAFGFPSSALVGPVIWNANTGNVVICRQGNPATSIYNSRYTVASGFNSNVTSVGFSDYWPSGGTLGLSFDGTNWYLNVYSDPNLVQQTGTLLSEALSSFIGVNFTHVGLGICSTRAVWWQHFKLVST